MTVDAFTRAAPALPLSRKQLRSIVQADAPTNIWTGAIRSGKTVASLLRWLIFCASAPETGQLVMVGRTRESLARNVFAVLQDPSIFGQLSKQCLYTPGAAFGYILGRKVWVFGASDSRAENILRGMTVCGAYGDEMTLWSEDLWVTLLGRMSVPGAQFFGTTNPDNPGHWLKAGDRGVDKVASLGWRHFHYLLEDNQWLLDNNPDYIARIKREYTGLYYRRFILGDWVQAEGAIYDMFDTGLHVIPAAAVPTIDHVYAVGMDVGTTNPTCAYLLGTGLAADGVQRLYIIGEWTPQTGLSDSALSGLFRSWLAGQPRPLSEPEWVFVDPAAKSLRVQLFEDGLQNVAPAHNAVLPGIRLVQSLLHTGLLQISDACPQLIKYLPGYSWDPKATAKGHDEPLKVDDHWPDAMRYAVYSSRALWRERVPLSAAGSGAPGSDDTAYAA